jgi:transcription antitermination factor NusG
MGDPVPSTIGPLIMDCNVRWSCCTINQRSETLLSNHNRRALKSCCSGLIGGLNMNDETVSSTRSSLPWFALYVRTRRERAVETALTEKGYETYLPMMSETRCYGNKKRNAEIPCFPSYLFCRVNPVDRLPVMTTPDVYSMVRRGTSLESIPDSELDALKIMISSRSPLERYPHLTTGDRVCITRGPLAGIEGVLLRVGNSQRVAVSIGLLRRSISAEVDSDDIMPAGPVSPALYHPAVVAPVHSSFAPGL